MPRMVANRKFTGLIREEAERGESVAIGRQGRPATGPAPRSADKLVDPGWAAAHRRMIERLEEGASLGGLRIVREDLYDR